MIISKQKNERIDLKKKEYILNVKLVLLRIVESILIIF